MADSHRRRLSSDSRGKTPAKRAQLDALPKDGVLHREMPSELPQWVKLAIADEVTTGASASRVCKRYGKSRSTYYKHLRSPAAALWREAVSKVNSSPEAAATAVLRASLANVTVEYMLAYQAAIEAGDYREIGVMSRDIFDRLGIQKQGQKSGSARPTIVINLGGGMSLDVPEVESSFEIQDAEYTVED